MVENTQDLLNLAKTFGVVWASIFFAWFLYYCAMLMRQMYLMMKETREKINGVNRVIKDLKSMFGDSAKGMAYIAEGIATIVSARKKPKKRAVKKRVKKTS